MNTRSKVFAAVVVALVAVSGCDPTPPIATNFCVRNPQDPSCVDSPSENEEVVDVGTVDEEDAGSSTDEDAGTTDAGIADAGCERHRKPNHKRHKHHAFGHICD